MLKGNVQEGVIFSHAIISTAFQSGWVWECDIPCLDSSQFSWRQCIGTYWKEIASVA